MVENFPYPGTGSPEDPNQGKPNRLTPRYTLIKMTNVKDREDSKGSKKKEEFIRKPP